LRQVSAADATSNYGSAGAPGRCGMTSTARSLASGHRRRPAPASPAPQEGLRAGCRLPEGRDRPGDGAAPQLEEVLYRRVHGQLDPAPPRGHARQVARYRHTRERHADAGTREDAACGARSPVFQFELWMGLWDGLSLNLVSV
jgi:hypothetical protein